MWNKTNYGAQVGHMKDAGLNPALMYGSAGQGGTTGSQGGGSASMGSSQQGKVMDLSNALMGAQIESLKAKANKDNADANKTGGVDTELTGQQTSESKQREALGLAQTNLTTKQLGEVEARVNKLVADTELTNRIKDMDYGGKFGKNYFENARMIFDRELDLGTYLGMATAIGSLTVIRSPKMMSKIGGKATKVVGGMINALKKKIGIGTKKVDTGGKLQWSKGWSDSFKMLDNN